MLNKNYFKQDAFKLSVLALFVIASVGFYLLWGMKASFWFTVEFRSSKLFVIMVVACAISVSTLIFQTLTRNKIVTPSIMGFDALFILLQTFIVFFYGASNYLQVNIYLKWLISISVMTLIGTVFYYYLFKKINNLNIMLLVGIILSILFYSLSSLMQRVMDPTEFFILQEMLFVSFSKVDSLLLITSAILLFIITSVVYILNKKFDMLYLGEVLCNNQGIAYQRYTLLILVLSSLLVAISTSLVGPVTFFGLLVVNLTYIVCNKYQHQFRLIYCIGISIVCLVLGEFIVQHFFKFTVRLSVVVEFLGGLTFLILVLARFIK